MQCARYMSLVWEVCGQRSFLARFSVSIRCEDSDLETLLRNLPDQAALKTNVQQAETDLSTEFTNPVTIDIDFAEPHRS